MTDEHQPTDEKGHVPETTADEDTEGQSMAALLAVRELSKTRRQAPKANEDSLPPLTKKFPRMRDDDRR